MQPDRRRLRERFETREQFGSALVYKIVDRPVSEYPEQLR